MIDAGIGAFATNFSLNRIENAEKSVFSSIFNGFHHPWVKVHAAAALISRLHMREPQSYSICLQNFPACNLKVKPLSLH